MNKLTLLSSYENSKQRFSELEGEQLRQWLIGFSALPTRTSFEQISLAFIANLSSSLLKSKECRKLPELVALGFWLRRTNLDKKIAESLACDVEDIDSFTHHQGLGTVVHFTPANVDTMFIYSWVASLLMGNKNIIRVASHQSLSKSLLLKIINELFSEQQFHNLARSNVFVGYDKSSDLSAYLSQLADARMMWGGDKSVSLIRENKAKVGCKDFAFADKYSIAIINESELMDDTHRSTITSKLWRDTQAFQQQACSSPRILFVIDDKTHSEAISGVAALLSELNASALGSESEWAQNNLVNEHVVTIQGLAAAGLLDEQCGIAQLETISALELSKLTAELVEAHTGNGLFYIVSVASINELAVQIKHCLPDKLQTVSLSPASQQHQNELQSLLLETLPRQAFRFQPMGDALDFSFQWDGYALLQALKA